MTARRLDRLLANLGYGSRREIATLAASGAIRFGERILDDPAERLTLTTDLAVGLTVSGEAIDPLPPLTLVMNKPAGLVCSHREPGRSVYELLPGRWRGRTPAISTVGRLDAETTGLLLLSDDGDLIHRITAPRRHVAKRYLARLERPLSGEETALFASGNLLLQGEDRPLKPARLEVLGPRLCRLTVSEGRHRQVRRMFAAAHNEVVSLHREAIGELLLPEDLASGAWRPLRAEERAKLLGEL
ncbi:MAG: pseudouridine synthase [Caulobacteraceae bacterium]